MAQTPSEEPTTTARLEPSPSEFFDLKSVRCEVFTPKEFKFSTYKSQPRPRRTHKAPTPPKPSLLIHIDKLDAAAQIAVAQLLRMAGEPSPRDGVVSDRNLHRIYRRLVRKYHPDTNKDFSAKETFLTVTECFTLVRAALDSKKAS